MKTLAFSSGEVIFREGDAALTAYVIQKGSVAVWLDYDTEEKQQLSVLKERQLLGEMGLTPAHVLKTTVFLADIADFGLINGIYAETFGPNFPARSCFQVAALPGGARIEIECVAAKEI